MAKSKNHTAHNQTYKQHKNGIKKEKKFRYSSRKGVRTICRSIYSLVKGICQQFLRAGASSGMTEGHDSSSP